MALRARKGDRAALEELVARTRGSLFRLAYAELRHFEDANDAVSASLLQICRSVGSLREPERVFPWMNSIVRNEAHRLRRGSPIHETLSLQESDSIVSHETDTITSLDIERALRRLPITQSHMIRQFYFAEQPISAIAADQATSVAAVKMGLHRGRRRLRAELEGYGTMTVIEREKSSVKSASTEVANAAILCDRTEPEALARIETALRRAGYAPRQINPEHFGEAGTTEPGPWDVLKNDGAIVLVEPFGKRSVFEIILLLRASFETAEIPVAVVTETFQPDSLTALAFHTLGVAGLASCDAPESLDSLFQWTSGGGQTRATLAAILFADDEARRAGQAQIGTEHLLLGLLRDKEMAQLLQNSLQVLPAQIAETVRQTMERRPAHETHIWRILTEPAQNAMRLAREAAAASERSVMETRHLLLGLVQESTGLAGHVLTEVGITEERVREACFT